jgi:sulfur carrier protein ThiS
MTIKVLKLGHSAQQIELPAGSTVQDALDKADMASEGYSLSINGLGVSSGAAVADGDIVTLVPKIEGGIV